MLRRRKEGLVIHYGGEDHDGWLPVGAALPVSNPRVSLVCYVQITEDSGFILECYARDPQFRTPPYSWDSWHESLEEAEAEALSELGIGPADWDPVH